MRIMTDAGEVKEALFNGYAIGDRLLEDVMFRVVLTSKGLSCPGVVDSAKTYMEKFSAKQMREWRSQVLDAVVNDGGMETPDGKEAWLEVDQDPYLAGIMGKEPETFQIRKVKAISGDDFLKRIIKSG